MALLDTIREYPSWFGAVAAAATTGLFSIIVVRISKRFDARGVSEAAMWNIGPEIIKNQNLRIQAQSEEIGRLWSQIYESNLREQKSQSEVAECKQQIRELEFQLRQLGILPHGKGHQNPEEGSGC
jgi:hypothetical protein